MLEKCVRRHRQKVMSILHVFQLWNWVNRDSKQKSHVFQYPYSLNFLMHYFQKLKRFRSQVWTQSNFWVKFSNVFCYQRIVFIEEKRKFEKLLNLLNDGLTVCMLFDLFSVYITIKWCLVFQTQYFEEIFLNAFFAPKKMSFQ